MISLIGRSPEEAAALLEGRRVTVLYGHPPRGAVPGQERVVRARERGAAVELTVCAFPVLCDGDKDEAQTGL